MKIVDAQVHVWGANTPERPWPARAEPHRAPLGKEELLAEMDKAGVDGVVIVPPSWEGDRNDLALEAASSHPDRFCIMGRFDPDAPGARDALAGWKKQKGMLGVRLTFHTEVLRQPLLDGRFDWVWGELEKHGIPAMVLFHHEYMHLADKVAERYPGLRLVLDHLGLKSGKDVTRGRELRHPRQGAGARQAAQRGGQGLGDAVLRRRQDLSVPFGSSAHPPRRRRVRPQAQLLGDRLVAAALQLPPGRDDVHRGNAVAQGRRPRVGDGPRHLRVDRLEESERSPLRQSARVTVCEPPPQIGR